MRFPYKGAGIALFYSNGNDDYILLGKRSDYPFHNRYSVPGGYSEINLDSSIEDNAYREFKEETSVDFLSLNTKYLSKWTLKIPFFSWTTFIYQTDTKYENFTPNEFYELKWINTKEVNKFKLRPFTMCEIKTFYKAHH